MTLLFLVVPVVAAIYLSPERGWLLVGAAMTLYLLFLGRWIVGRPLGILINERNLMSLSRFQMIAWTVLLLSAFVVIALKRLAVLSAAAKAVPLNIGMNWQLWALMGISATSLVGTPLILGTKAAEAPDQKSVKDASEALGESAASIENNSQGKLYANWSVSDAALSDMFQGDLISDTAHVDIAKVQMFYFTLIALIAYGYGLFQSMANIYPWDGFAFPPLSEAMLGLLGISHAAYLTSKTATKG